MQFSRQRQRSGNDVHILSLVAIIFLLIIFFMVAGRLSRPDTTRIKPPYSVSQTATHHVGLLVEVTSAGSIALAGETVKPQNLASDVRKFMTTHPEGVVRLKADALTDASRVIAVMAVLRDAGVERLRLLTTEVKH